MTVLRADSQSKDQERKGQNWKGRGVCRKEKKLIEKSDGGESGKTRAVEGPKPRLVGWVTKKNIGTKEGSEDRKLSD